MSDEARIRRLADRAVENREQIYSILDDGFLCHVAYIREGNPVVIPTLYARDGNRVLLHGSNSSGFVRAAREGSPLSIGVTHVDAILAARSGFHSSANYRSVVIHGRGSILEDGEKELALDLIVDWMIPGRAADIRRPTGTELKQTSVVAVDLSEISAKVRAGDPKDDPADLDSGTWAGLIPIEQTRGAPVPAADLGPAVSVPDYLTPA